MRWALLALLVVHGLIHFMGFAHAFGLAELPQLSGPTSRPLGLLWLAAGCVVLVAAVWLAVSPRTWWMAGCVAVALSQGAIFSAWGDAKLGTVANVVLLVAIAYTFAAEGPASLRARYRAEVDARLAAAPTEPREAVTQGDLAALPAPVRTYLERTGVVGRPKPHHLAAALEGRIRASPDDPWMEFTAEQYDFLDEPARFFLMDARRKGLPIDVLHRYRGGDATMHVRLLSLLPIAEAGGAELGKTETVTVLNDLALMVPGGLVDPAIRWEPIDDRSARAHYTVGGTTVRATLFFDDAGDLVDFVSDDRSRASSDGSELTRQRWSTPVSEYRSFGPHRAMTSGEGRWHTPQGVFTYLEIRLVELRVDGSLK